VGPPEGNYVRGGYALPPTAATNLAFAFFPEGSAGKLLALPDGKLPPLKGGLEAVGRASSQLRRVGTRWVR
jgi:hypothetical protein